ncbi:MAG: trypsin-like peptidase domain-containing protein [Candidatus Bipolaricaulota bacterium]|nr:trypsin-like peptidase domain-containing protein [Candidatus Bipolaricaulota bacterium]
MRRITLVGLLVLVLVGAGLTVAWVRSPNSFVRATGVAAVAQGGDADQSITDSGHSAVKQAIAAVGPAVVRIDVTATVDASTADLYNQLFGTPLQNQQETQGVGSGFVIAYGTDKYVLTNAHVVAGADTIKVVDPAGKVWDAEVVGADDVVDVAVLRVKGDAASLATATLGDSDRVETGDWAIAIGNPLGLSYSVTMGIVSATGRDMAKPDSAGTFYDLIQTDAAINPGNSGGPLVNSLGEVIGINTMITRSTGSGVTVEGINFAVPINSVKAVLTQLVENGAVKRGWLGVGIGDITSASAAATGIDPNLKGALVTRIFSGDPADVAGIKVKDVITRVGTTAIIEAADVSQVVGALAAGATVEIGLVRDGQPLVVSVILGERPSEADLADYTGQGSSTDTSTATALGMTVGPITEVVAGQLGLNSTAGVVIMEIARGGRAESAGLNAGDVILGVNQQAVNSVDAWNAAVASLGASEQITLTVFHAGRLVFVTL